MKDLETPAAEGDGNSAQRAVSTLLVLVTVLLGILCVFMLSCTLTHTRIASIALSGVNVSVWKLDDIRKQWQALRHNVNHQSELLALAQQDSAKAAGAVAAYDFFYRPARTALDAKMGPLIGQIRAFDESLAAMLAMQGPVERIETLQSQRERLAKGHPEIEDDLKDILILGESYKKIDAERIRLNSDADARAGQRASLEKGRDQSRALLDNLFSTQLGVKPIDDAMRTRIENALYELYSDSWLGGAVNAALVLPPEILTLLLVVLMGVLGSSLQLTHQLFVRKEKESIGVYSLRLVVGAITALVIFIIAKAGVPVIADASKLGGDTPINPYFVSFLAIISGLMSDKAIASVQAIATKYFDDGVKDTPRWALPTLEKAYELSKRPAADCAQRLEISETTFKNWIGGKEEVPLTAQKILAAIFNVSLRDVFSDIPPDQSAAPSTEDTIPHTSP